MRRPKAAPAAPVLKRSAVSAAVEKAVRDVRVVDPVTTLRQPAIASLRRAGIDDLLNDTRLVAEAVRSLGMTYRRFWHLTAEKRSELLWRHLFVEHVPLSTAARGVIASLQGLGLTPKRGDQAKIRRWFAEKRPDWLVDRVFEVAGVESVVSVVDPFVDVERRRWQRGLTADARFRSSLRLDGLVLDWPNAVRQLAEWDYQVSLDFGGDTVGEVERFLQEWSDRVEPVSLSIALPPTFRFPHSGPAARLLEDVVLPECERLGRPLAAVVGEVPEVNPGLRHAGFVRRPAELGPVENLLARSPDVRIVLTAVAAANDEEVTAQASVFPNLHPAGVGARADAPAARALVCDRLALLGATFTPFVSRARVLDQLISTWGAARAVVRDILTEHYRELADSGLGVTRRDVVRDAKALLGGSFARFSGFGD